MQQHFMRTCRRCKQDLPATLDVFPPQKMGKFGLYTHCRPCKKLEDAERRARPDQKARQQAWRDQNKDQVKRYNEQYRAAGYSSTEDVRRWRSENLAAARKADREKQAKYRRTKTWHALKHRIGTRMRSMLAGCGGKARVRTEELLGYTLEELQAHIERQFTTGMSWEAFHRGEIHIDHIVPVAAFKPASATCQDFRACWALTNLRPMWAKDNMRKGARLELLL